MIEVTDSEIESVIRTNLFAPLCLAGEALPELFKTKGSIINISGTLSKGVMPGFTATEMTKDMDPAFVEAWEELSRLGRIGQPDEVAPVVTFPAGEDARRETGQVVQAGGGVMM